MVKIKTAICYVNKKDQPIVVSGNIELHPDDDKPEYHWSDEA